MYYFYKTTLRRCIRGEKGKKEVYAKRTSSFQKHAKKVQLWSAQIITCFPILAFKGSLFLETGLVLLLSSRSAAKLVIMYKVHNNEVSQYLKEAISSNTYTSTYMHNLRNGDYA